MPGVLTPEGLESLFPGDLLEASIPTGILPASVHLQVRRPALAVEGVPGPGNHGASLGPTLFEQGLLALRRTVAFHDLCLVSALRHPADYPLELPSKLGLEAIQVATHRKGIGLG
jgi:hypothetical protein